MGKGARNRRIRDQALDLIASAAPRTAHRSVQSVARALRRRTQHMPEGSGLAKWGHDAITRQHELVKKITEKIDRGEITRPGFTPNPKRRRRSQKNA